jgi:predicted esterase
MRVRRTRGWWRFVLASACALILGAAPMPGPLTVDEFTSYTALIASPLKRLRPRLAWKQVVPEVKEVRIPSSADGSRQPALFHAPADRAESRPLLVVLHSWSVDYLDRASAPYGLWAVRNDWVFIHPEYRGRFDRPEATGSELAVQDILDAVEYARAHAKVDPDRIYLVGYSGGAMMALTMAGRNPELWAGVVAWVPVFDLAQWHEETRRKYPRYARNIRDSCGGEPVAGSEAAEECRRRSPSTYLGGARGKGVRVLICAGIEDPLVSPAHSLAAFNVLASREDRFSEEQIRRVAEEGAVPTEGDGAVEDARYEQAGRPLLLRRGSGQVTLHLYRGRHDVIYNAGLLWLAGLKR